MEYARTCDVAENLPLSGLYGDPVDIALSMIEATVGVYN